MSFLKKFLSRKLIATMVTMYVVIEGSLPPEATIVVGAIGGIYIAIQGAVDAWATK